MKNPLMKRLPRELKQDFTKYLVIFLFMLLTISFISGFLIASGSMIKSYNDSFKKYNIEHGNFDLSDEPDDSIIKNLEKDGIRIYPNYYWETVMEAENLSESEHTLRIFQNRTEVDRICLMQGDMPEKESEIALDRMFAENNEIKIGDMIHAGDKEYTVTGLVAFSDYSTLFSDNNDMMFDAVLFGLGVTTREGFERLSDSDGKLHYNYAWRYPAEPENEKAEKEWAEEFLEALVKETAPAGLTLKTFVPRYQNQAINFTGEDMGSDKSMMTALLYIVIVIMAFVFAVTINNTIISEAAVIGTLRASGYTRGELLKHYVSLPILITVLAALLGNVLGYTYFKDFAASMYYGSYSLPTFVTIWNAEAFIKTTVVPLILMLVINLSVVSYKLKLSPLCFIRRELNRKKRKKAVRLPKLKFLNRFRLRIILQNFSSYLTLFLGIVFADLLLLFGLMLVPLLDHTQAEIKDNILSDHQYILKAPAETETEGAEKVCLASLYISENGETGEEINIFGIQEVSSYLPFTMKTGEVYISEAYAEKKGIKAGDVIDLKDKYEDTSYSFTVTGTYDYPAGLAVFLPIDDLRGTFDYEKDYYNAYFSDQEITDIPEEMIASVITEEDLTKVSRQLKVSMGELFKLWDIFAVILSLLLIYLLTKLIIEKNSYSISVIKILGYENREISGLYLMATTWVVIFSAILGLLIADRVLRLAWQAILSSYNGWLPYYVSWKTYAAAIEINLATFAVVALFQMKKLYQVPMDLALKNVE